MGRLGSHSCEKFILASRLYALYGLSVAHVITGTIIRLVSIHQVVKSLEYLSRFDLILSDTVIGQSLTM